MEGPPRRELELRKAKGRPSVPALSSPPRFCALMRPVEVGLLLTASAVRADRARVVAVYNYKGGCGKTTTLLNLASALRYGHGARGSGLDKNVLLVDCDPQCNLTSFMYPDPDTTKDEDEGEDEDEGDDDGLQPGISRQESLGISPPPESFSQNVTSYQIREDVPAQPLEILTSGREDMKPNLYDFLIDFIKGDKGASIDSNLDNIQQRPLNFRADKNVFLIPGPSLQFPMSTHMMLLGTAFLKRCGATFPGHPDVIRLEKEYGAQLQSDSNKPFAHYALRYLIDRAVERHNIDVVLVDFGPSASTLNISWIASCDFILPPTFADYFNVSSLHGLLTSVASDSNRSSSVSSRDLRLLSLCMHTRCFPLCSSTTGRDVTTRTSRWRLPSSVAASNPPMYFPVTIKRKASLLISADQLTPTPCV